MRKRTLTYGALGLALLFALPACEGDAEEDADKQGTAEQAEAAPGFQGVPGQDGLFVVEQRPGLPSVETCLTTRV